AQPAPAALPGEGENAVQWSLGDDREVDALRDMLCRALHLIQKRGAGGAGAFQQRKERRMSAGGAGPPVRPVTGKHHAVDDERVLAWREELGQPDVARAAVRPRALEEVVLGDDSPRRELPPCSGYRLHGAAQLDLFLEETLARRPVL